MEKLSKEPSTKNYEVNDHSPIPIRSQFIYGNLRNFILSDSP